MNSECKETIDFFIPGNPVPQGRGRIVKKGLHYGIIDPEKSKSWKTIVAMSAQQQCPGQLLEGPLDVSLLFVFQEAKSEKKNAIYRDKKPDIDNLIKAIFDALTGVVYRGDQQIVRVDARKVYELKGSAIRGTPGVWVYIRNATFLIAD